MTTTPKHDVRHQFSSSGQGCEPGYEPCLPITGDLDCADIEVLGPGPVHVSGSDPYRLDGDGDGVGVSDRGNVRAKSAALIDQGHWAFVARLLRRKD